MSLLGIPVYPHDVIYDSLFWLIATFVTWDHYAVQCVGLPSWDDYVYPLVNSYHLQWVNHLFRLGNFQ